MKKRFFFYLFLAFILFTTTGCGNKRYDLSHSKIEVNYDNPGMVNIVVQDTRSYIVDGEKASTYLGRHILGNGIPRTVHTRDNKTVAYGVGNIIALSLERRGFKVKLLEIPPQEIFDISDVKSQDKLVDRTILLSINQLKVDSFKAVELTWDLQLIVYDDKQQQLALKHNEGVDDSIVENDFGAISSGQAQTALTGKLSTILFEIMSDEDIKGALNIIEPKTAITKPVIKPVAEGAALTENNDEDFSEAQAIITAMNESLSNSKALGFNKAAKEAFRLRISEDEYLDQIVDIILAEQAGSDRAIIDGVCYLLKSFKYNKNSRYKDVFTDLRQNARYRKVRKYAASALRYFPPTSIEQYYPEPVSN